VGGLCSKNLDESIYEDTCHGKKELAAGSKI